MTPQELETLCKDWPGVASSIKWEDDLVFTVAAKMFAVTGLRGPHSGRLSFKVDKDRFLEAGCDGYISKPIDVKTFISAIEQYMR